MSRDEQPADVFGNTCDMLNGRACAELGLYIVKFEAMGPDHARKGRVHHRQFEAIHRPAKHAHAVEQFDAAEHPAIKLIVPVGAIVVTVALRRCVWRLCRRLPRCAGNKPR